MLNSSVLYYYYYYYYHYHYPSPLARTSPFPRSPSRAPGEALNIDLSDFIAQLYTIVLSSSLAPDMDSTPAPAFKSDAPSPSSSYQSQSTADLLFRALRLAFHPHPSAGAAPPWRAAAFAKRLLTAALHWPAPRVLAALAFVEELLARDPKL